MILHVIRTRATTQKIKQLVPYIIIAGRLTTDPVQRNWLQWFYWTSIISKVNSSVFNLWGLILLDQFLSRLNQFTLFSRHLVVMSSSKNDQIESCVTRPDWNWQNCGKFRIIGRELKCSTILETSSSNHMNLEILQY